MAKASITMLAYAVVILVIGYTTFLVAPPGANAGTALMIPLVMAILMVVCGVGTLLVGRNRRVGLLCLYGGIVLPLLFAVAVAAGRLPKSLGAAMDFTRAVEESASGVIVAKSRADGEPHPAGYQAVGMMGIVVSSGLAFVVLVLHWPKAPALASPSEPPVSGEE